MEQERNAMPTAVVVDAIRTPLGKRNGQLAGWHPVDLLAHVLTTLTVRSDLDPALVDDVIAAGIESMTRVPMGSSVLGADPFGARLVARYPELVPQGISAEMIAERWGFTREQLDAFALESQQRAARATAEARFDREIVP